MEFKLNYDEVIHLDAEDLAETGIGDAYESLLPKLRQFVERPAAIKEVFDNDLPRYLVRYREKEYVIYSPNAKESEENSWGNATYALFDIINDQLAQTSYRFYAINGGNDLGGMFLTPAQSEAARRSLPNKAHWPYLPVLEHPWYGQYH
jgi:hypothetical protein